MCGIFGTTLRYSPDTIRKKLDLMKFRGPDHTGSMEIKTPNGTAITLGHVRLSIIDLDTRSNQPFAYNDNISIVFNGEVYNYIELRQQYLSDVTFRTESDTEVVCAMYEKFGVDAVKFLNGMFAFAIYDKKNNIIVGARDRLGKKPFYYWHSDKGLEFASQLKVIHHTNKFEIDEEARLFYLHQTYIPDPYSIYREVRKLRAGQSFTYDIQTNILSIQQYWEVNTNSCNFQSPKSYEEAKETIKELLFDAVKLRLNANVPVGMFLSGGIDSSLVCAIVSKINKDICAYTIGFENSRYDESLYARSVAEALEIPIKVSMCSGDDQRSIFNDYVQFFDEPFADNSLIPSSLVAQKAREDVTVALGGDGGDELFYGYPKYEYTRLRMLQYKKPYWLRLLAAPYIRWRRGKKDMEFSMQKDCADVYRSEGLFCTHLYGAETFNRFSVGKRLPDRNIITRERGVLAYCDYDIKNFMNAVNQKTDRATMRSSLELRNPIMDYRIAEYSRLLPYEYQYNSGLGLKRILKDILYEMVPRELLDRPKKGFVPPTNEWFRGELKEKFEATVTQQNVTNLLPEIDPKRIMSLKDQFLKGGNIDSRIFWVIYNYINWWETYQA